WSLQHEIDSSMGNGLAHTLGFVADDGVDILGRDHFRRGSDNVRKERFAANFVQHFRMFRFQPRAFTRSHDGDRHPLRALTPALRMGHSDQYNRQSLPGGCVWHLPQRNTEESSAEQTNGLVAT